MPDNPKKKRPLDVSRINIHQPHEVAYWCSALGVSEAKLREAVMAVGTSAAAVRRYLGR